jgi:hypothetical protein
VRRTCPEILANCASFERNSAFVKERIKSHANLPECMRDWSGTPTGTLAEYGYQSVLHHAVIANWGQVTKKGHPNRSDAPDVSSLQSLKARLERSKSLA